MVIYLLKDSESMNHMNKNRVKKAVIPVAGKGTRFLPATKEIAKEMLPIVNIPMIYYVVKEAVDSGIEQIIFITSTGKHAVANFFDRNLELETFLEKSGKTEYLDIIRKMGDLIEIITIHQKEQLGLGHAINMAGSIINEEDSFAVLLGDEILINQNKPVLKQLMEIHHQHGGPVIAAMNVPADHINRYGIITGTKIAEQTYQMTDMVEKPKVGSVSSTLATPGRYILDGKIFEYLKKIPRGSGGEYQLTDAIKYYLADHPMFAYEFIGERFDTGSIDGYLEATVEFALRDPQYGEIMRKIIQSKIGK